ncbi:LOW QUALITY PROTEIN: TNF receptor-associated factor 6-like [Centruroides vittatus]|uniref:LOW QUALITY PROTEIN: TNF receptor-associated factor 6-like n=1 Tax=Centruroides vittatus TaxID=120091 RepID=UPI003510ADC4
MEKGFRRQGYDYEFVPILDLKFECPICYMCLRDAVQTECGHLFCEDCILHWISKEKRCPLDKQMLTKEKISSDNDTRREIQALKVQCPQIKNGCNVITELKTIELHESTCGYQMNFCSLGCGEKLYRKDVDCHRETCTHSPSQCEYCQEEFPRVNKLEHYKVCNAFLISCKYCNILVSRGDMECHIQKDCPRVIVSCQFEDIGCPSSLVERQYLRDHNLKSLDIHISLLHQSLNETIQENKLKNYVKSINESKPRMENFDAHSLQLNQELIRKIKDTFERKLDTLEKRLVSIEEKLTQGIFHWKVNNFSVHEQKALNGTTVQLKSNPFYSNLYSYRLFLSMTLKKTESNDLMLSLYVHLMKGENDDFLPWPFSGKVDLSILDQKSNASGEFHKLKSVCSDPKLDALQRPITEFNSKGFGCKEFIEVSILHTQSYLKNDALIIRAKIRPNVTL